MPQALDEPQKNGAMGNELWTNTLKPFTVNTIPIHIFIFYGKKWALSEQYWAMFGQQMSNKWAIFEQARAIVLGLDPTAINDGLSTREKPIEHIFEF